MKVVFNPAPHQRGSGWSSYYRWDHPDMKKAMESLFGVPGPHGSEDLTTIEVDEDGITARFKYKD